MTERPILFSGPMVRAILEGRKTQTRRVVKSPAQSYAADHMVTVDSKGVARIPFYDAATNPPTHDWMVVRCPYGVPGDRLWVRERHCFLDVSKSAMSKFEGARPHWNVTVEWSDGAEREMRVEGAKPKQTRERGECRWRPGIHMPRWACRLVLEVTAVRVERLQEISAEDALAEGIADRWSRGNEAWPAEHCDEARAEYRALWDSLNAKRAPWASNPWVWMVEFRRAA